MAQWGYSGLIQFYIMAELCGMIALSILEMFYYRLQVTVLHQKLPVYIKLSKFRVWLFRFSLVLIPVIATITFSPAIISQEEAAMDTWKKNPEFPPEITCYSVIIAATASNIFWLILFLYFFEIIIAVSGAVGPLIYIVRFMSKNFRLSKETKKLQRVLLMSLFIQGSIHGIFIFIPVFFQFYALFFQLTSNDFAFVMLLSFAYHGFLSTCAMIIFTKPLRIRMFFCSRWTSKTEQQTQLPSLTKAITNI
uniref:Serpentine Receptor, class H n=1 Tax=Caenorhabditis tropicalis TaxID=1561998 RepID=A0A1I7TRG8_9PELO